MSNWIFVMTSTVEEFKRRVNEKKWPIYAQTTHREKLREGDNVIFYIGGRAAMDFVGKARVSSKLTPIGDSNYFVSLSNIELWKKRIPVKNILQELKFILNKKKWGAYFQGGVIRLPDNDYNSIFVKSQE